MGNGLDVGPVHDLGGCNGVNYSLGVVNGLRLFPNRGDCCGLDVGADFSNSNSISHDLCLGRGLDGCNSRSNCGGHSLLNGLRIIDDARRDPNLGQGRRLDNGSEFSHSDKVSHRLLKGLGCGIGLGRGLSVEVGLCLSLSGSKSVLDSHGVINDLGRHPDAGCRHNFDRSNDSSNIIDISHNLGDCLVHRDGSWDGLRIDMCLGSRHRHCLDAVVVVSSVITVVVALTVVDVVDIDNRGGVTLIDLREP